MTKSQNGWPASESKTAIGIRPFEVGGVSFPQGVKSGDVATIFRYLFTEMDRRVEPIHDGWCWGYYYKPIKGTGVISNHGSGTACDWNAPKHPYGVSHTFNRKQTAEIRKILDELENVVRWGAAYADEMHFEINASAAAVKRVAAKLKPKGWDEMATKAEVQAACKAAVKDALDEWKITNIRQKKKVGVEEMLSWMHEHILDVKDAVSPKGAVKK